MTSCCKLFCLILMSAFALFAPTHSKALPLDAEAVVNEVQKTYGALTSLSAKFNQTIMLPGRPGGREGRGTAVFLQPSFMRWQYNAPEKQLFLNDGSFLTIYQEQQKQMVLAPVGSMDQDLTHLIFSGSAPLADTFDIQSAPQDAMPLLTDKTLRVVRLVPKKTHNQVSVLYLAIGLDNLIHAIRMQDHFETVTDIHFFDIRPDSLDVSSTEKRRRLIMDLFTFTPPADTDIIQQ